MAVFTLYLSFQLQLLKLVSVMTRQFSRRSAVKTNIVVAGLATIEFALRLLPTIIAACFSNQQFQAVLFFTKSQVLGFEHAAFANNYSAFFARNYQATWLQLSSAYKASLVRLGLCPSQLMTCSAFTCLSALNAHIEIADFAMKCTTVQRFGFANVTYKSESLRKVQFMVLAAAITLLESTFPTEEQLTILAGIIKRQLLALGTDRLASRNQLVQVSQWFFLEVGKYFFDHYNNNRMQNEFIGSVLTTEIQAAVTDQEGELVACKYCTRKFFQERIDGHESVCQKTTKTRKAFNSQNHRLGHLGITPKVDKCAPKAATKAKWRVQHEQFLSSIRNIKAVGTGQTQQQGKKEQLQDFLVQCKFCQRRFDAQVAKRHVPNCEKIIHRPKPPKKKQAIQSQEVKIQNQVNQSDQRLSAGVLRNQGSVSEPIRQERRINTLKMPLLPPVTMFKQNKEAKDVRLLQRLQSHAAVQCPTCNRKFQFRAAERHIPICKKLTQAQPFFRRGASTTKDSAAPARFNSKMKSEAQQSKKQVQSIQKNDQKFCTRCGGKFQPRHRYCGFCGKKKS